MGFTPKKTIQLPVRMKEQRAKEQKLRESTDSDAKKQDNFHLLPWSHFSFQWKHDLLKLPIQEKKSSLLHIPGLNQASPLITFILIKKIKACY